MKRIKIKPIEVKHGKVTCICYILENKLAYISDVSSINPKKYIHFI